MGNFNRDRSGSRRDFGRRSFNNYGGSREMHKTVCSECGKDCEVPFRPTGSKPVYCNECFKKNRGGNDSRRFNYERRNESRPQNNIQFEEINRKLDKILEMLTIKHVKKDKEVESKPDNIIIIPEKKAKITKKKTSLIKSPSIVSEK